MTRYVGNKSKRILLPLSFLEESADFWQYVPAAFEGDDTVCWLWMGPASFEQGYGDYRGWGAHRVAYFIANNGAQPGKLLVRHSCNNPPCCNPAHLLLGNHKQNAADMMAAGRYREGAGKGKRKRPPLTVDEINEIYNSREFARRLAERYQVSTWIIHAIRNERIHQDKIRKPCSIAV